MGNPHCVIENASTDIGPGIWDTVRHRKYLFREECKTR